MNDCYSPHTGEHIQTDTPASWMGRAGIAAPEYDTAASGCFWRGDAWEIVPAQPASPPVPQVVSKRQGRQALIIAGKFAAVQAAIDAIDDDTERLLAQSWWDDSAEYERTNPFLQLLAKAIRLDDAALDALFVTGGGL